MKYYFTLLIIALFSIGVQAQEYELNGSLGVGVNPANDKKLDVDGDTKLRGNTDVDGALFLTSAPSKPTLLDKLLYLDDNKKVSQIPSAEELMLSLYAQPNKMGPGADDCVTFWNAGNNLMTIGCDDIRVGISTANPEATLHADGNLLLDYDFNSLLGGSAEDMIRVRYDGGTRFKVHRTGYFESVVTSGTADFWRAKDSNSQDVYVMRSNGSFRTNLQSGAPSAFEAWNGNDEIFHLDNDGCFHSKLIAGATKAISIFEPGPGGHEIFRVNVEGHVYATKVIVESTPFPDYVFEKDYKLMPLNELKKFIETNKHLPNMPTSKSVEENGADLGEINRLLVEKVEELTLYVLHVNDTNQELQKQIDEIKKMMLQSESQSK